MQAAVTFQQDDLRERTLKFIQENTSVSDSYLKRLSVWNIDRFSSLLCPKDFILETPFSLTFQGVIVCPFHYIDIIVNLEYELAIVSVPPDKSN